MDPTESHPVAAPRAATTPSALIKTPGFAAVLSFVPGLGNIYNGLYQRGVAFFLVVAGIFALAVQVKREEELGFLIPCLIFTWLFNVFDAHRQATLINLGYAPDLGIHDAARLRTASGGGMMVGVALFVIGLYGALREYFDLDLSWVINQWPLLLMGFGIYTIRRAWKQRQASGEPGEPLDDLLGGDEDEAVADASA